MKYFLSSKRTPYSEQHFWNFILIETNINRVNKRSNQIPVNYLTSQCAVIYWMDTQGWEVSWEKKSSPIHLGMSSQRGTKWIPVIQVFQWSQRHTCTLFLHRNVAGMPIFQFMAFYFIFLTSSFCWTSFCWIRARYKQKEVWFQGYSMSESDGSELNVLICLFEICLNVLFSLHRAYYSTPMVSSWEMVRFVRFAPNMKITEYQWLIHKKNKNKRSSTSTRDAITTRE